MKKDIKGFTADAKPAKIDANAPKQGHIKSQPITSGKGGKNGMPDAGTKPAKV